MDKRLINALNKEEERQKHNIELIASENYVSRDVLALSGSIFTNKYAEGYPKSRYYNGCDNVDTVEEIAIEYLKKLFNCEHANVQPHSGSSANMAVYMAVLKPGDTILGMDLKAGGHLTHGFEKSFSGQLYKSYSYGLDENELLDYDEIKRIAIEVKPKLIIAGASAYAREIDFSKFREIADEVGAYLMVDMAHIAGLIAAGLHQNPCPYADFVTSTTHKTLRGPRGGIILCKKEYAKKIDSIIFPGIQGGPLMHIIAAKAQCFYEALQDDFKDYALQVIKNCKVMAEEFKKAGLRLVSDGTDNHLLLIDLTSFNISGKEAANVLDEIYITCNKNAILNDPRSPWVTSGIRLGSAAMTTRGFKEAEFIKTANIIVRLLKDPHNEVLKETLRKEVIELTKPFDIYR